MKLTIFFILFLLTANSYCQVGIGTVTPNPSATLDVSSDNKGFLPPRMSTAQRDAIATPAAGLIIFNTTTNEIEFYNGTSWVNSGNLAATSLPVKKLMGTTASDLAYDIKATPDGGYIFTAEVGEGNKGTLMNINGFGANDIWVVKLNAKCNIEWQKLFGSNGMDGGRSVISTADGGYAVAGMASGSDGSFAGATHNGFSDVCLIKLDAAGNTQWVRLYGGTQNDVGVSLKQTPDGGYVIAGYSGSSNNGTLTGIFGNGINDGYIIKTSATGNILWQKLLGGSNSEFLLSLEVNTDGSLVFAGYSTSSNTGTFLGVSNNGSNDAWVIKLTSAGALVWQKLLGGLGDESFSYISPTSDNGFIMGGGASSNGTGTLTGTSNLGGTDGWIIKMDGNGNLQWQKVYGGSATDGFNYVSETIENGFIVSGITASSNTGTINIVNNGAGTYDAWMMRLDATGNTLWQKLYGGTLDDQPRSCAITADGNILILSYTSSSNTGSLSGLVNYGVNDVWLYKIDKYGNGL